MVSIIVATTPMSLFRISVKVSPVTDAAPKASLIHILLPFPDETTSTVFGVDMTWFVLIVVGVLLVLSALIVAIAICVCRRQDENAANQNTALQRK